VVTLAGALMGVMAAAPADAATRHAAPTQAVQAKAPRPAADPIMAVVSIKNQQVTFYDADGWILRAPVSTGTTGRETPAGVFAVVEKNKDHHSSLYDDAWMPNMLRITWNGIALHGGPLPGYAASHGCVRMPYDFAASVFDKAPMGMRVVIAPGDAEPVTFSDPKLFVPKPDAMSAIPGRAEAAGREADEAARAAAAAKTAAMAAKREAAPAVAAARNLESLKKHTDADLAYAEKMSANAKTDRQRAMAEDMKQKIAAKTATLPAQLDAARANAKAKQDAAAAADEAAKTAETKRSAAVQAATDARLAGAPVSIYISRSTQKLYVRRDTHQRVPDGGERYDTSLEFPVTIKDPDKPIGTHIFTAVARDTAGTSGGLRWTEVSIDDGDSAKNALDRITFPQEVLDRIAPTALPLSSIIISDEPLSSETNYRTEFVAVLSNQPQGGFENRGRSPDMIARDSGEYGWGFGGYGRQREWAPSYGYGYSRQPSRSYYQPRGWWN
jgi:lipoprotein-anchoring transpeptidase ErfK/SrfK